MKKRHEPAPPKPARVRKNITMPTWVHDDAVLYGAKRGFGLSELITRQLEKFITEEKERIGAVEDMAQRARDGLNK